MNFLTKQELWASRTSSAQLYLPAKGTDVRGCTTTPPDKMPGLWMGRWSRFDFCNLKSMQDKVTAMGNTM